MKYPEAFVHTLRRIAAADLKHPKLERLVVVMVSGDNQFDDINGVLAVLDASDVTVEQKQSRMYRVEFPDRTFVDVQFCTNGVKRGLRFLQTLTPLCAIVLDSAPITGKVYGALRLRARPQGRQLHSGGHLTAVWREDGTEYNG